MAREFPPDYTDRDFDPVRQDKPFITGEQLWHANATAIKHEHQCPLDQDKLTDLLLAFRDEKSGDINVAYRIIMWRPVGLGDCMQEIIRVGILMEHGREVIDLHRTLFLGLGRLANDDK